MFRRALWTCRLVFALNALASAPVWAAPPSLDVVFPAGGKAGESVEVTVSGSALNDSAQLQLGVNGAQCERLAGGRFRMAIPPDTVPGLYELWVSTDGGVSGPRTFFIGNRRECVEVEPNDGPTGLSNSVVPMPSDVVTPDVTINGRIDKPGDSDGAWFTARRGQVVVAECWAERLESRLRGVLEIFDASGRRLAANRGYYGTDPLIAFRAPADGQYLVRISDLISSGGADYYYRLDLDSGPRAAFTRPCAVERGKACKVTVFGWNLQPGRDELLQQLDVDLSAQETQPTWPLPFRWRGAQAVVSARPLTIPGGHVAIPLSITDVPVHSDHADNHSPESAQLIEAPSEVSGELLGPDEVDWYAVDAARGEVFYFEAFGQRIGSPVDLQIELMDNDGRRPLATFQDEPENLGGRVLPTDHLDPSGRWVAPSSGRFWIALRDMARHLPDSPHRGYRLSVRRVEPDFQVIVFPRSEETRGLHVPRGGRLLLDVIALRQRGMSESICIRANDLPVGLECPDVWMGPTVDRATLVVSASASLERNSLVGPVALRWEASTLTQEARPVFTGLSIRGGTPNGWGRLSDGLRCAVTEDAPIRATADAHPMLQHHLYGPLRVRHSPGGIVDVAVRIERREAGHAAPVRITGVGLPLEIRNASTVIPPGESEGYLSFVLPPTLPIGRYSWTIAAETTVAVAGGKTEPASIVTSPVTVDVQPAMFDVWVDPAAPTRARRGETIQIKYGVRRLNGFIGKVHTELAAPGKITDVVGLRGRGETFVGQTDKGQLQVIINDDAPLGRQHFLRLLSVGVVEDQPIYHGAVFVDLEVAE